MKENCSSRLERLRERMVEARFSGLLVSHLPNIFYLVGFTGSAGALLLTARETLLFTDARYRTQAREEVIGAEVEITPDSLAEAAARRLGRQSRGRLGFEAAHAPFSLYESLRHAVPRSIRVAPATGLVEGLRAVKDGTEVEKIRRAVKLAADVFDSVLEFVRPGAVERDLAAEIDYRMRRRGAEGPAFDTIVASGPRGALPHGRASAKRLRKNEFIVFDLGAILARYSSDMTRTVYLGRPSSRARQLYEAVRSAQLRAIETVKPGVPAERVDSAARRELRRQGLARYFVHSTGHGVGLEIHEEPRIGRGRRTPLAAGNVITIEPGIYLPGRLGIRIEDVVVVTESGAEVLTPTTKELITL